MKKAVSMVLAMIVALSLTVPVFAAQVPTVSPCYTNAQQAKIIFDIDNNGNGSVTVRCVGNSNVSHIRAVTYLERYDNGEWVRVDIGTTNNQWVNSVFDTAALMSYSPKLTVKGQYRASTIITLTAATVEVIRLNTTCTY